MPKDATNLPFGELEVPPEINIPAWVFCMSWYADFEFRVTQWICMATALTARDEMAARNGAGLTDEATDACIDHAQQQCSQHVVTMTAVY